jgi:hypothetical protein
VRLLTLDATRTQSVRLAKVTVIVDYSIFVWSRLNHSDHHVEADGALDGLGTLVFEGGGLGLLVDGEARAAVVGIDFLVEAVAAQSLRALNAVVHFIKDESARAGTLAKNIRTSGRGQRIHLCYYR